MVGGSERRIDQVVHRVGGGTERIEILGAAIAAFVDHESGATGKREACCLIVTVRSWTSDGGQVVCFDPGVPRVADRGREPPFVPHQPAVDILASRRARPRVVDLGSKRARQRCERLDVDVDAERASGWDCSATHVSTGCGRNPRLGKRGGHDIANVPPSLHSNEGALRNKF